MVQRSMILALFACAIIANPSVASACDRPGHFRAHLSFGQHYQLASPTPGNILLITRRMQDRQIAHWLASAGHNVKVVDDASRLEAIFESQTVDIIIGQQVDGAATNAEIANAGSAAIFMPIVEDTSAKKDYNVTLSHRDFEPRRLLTRVHQAMKRADQATKDLEDELRKLAAEQKLQSKKVVFGTDRSGRIIGRISENKNASVPTAGSQEEELETE